MGPKSEKLRNRTKHSHFLFHCQSACPYTSIKHKYQMSNKQNTSYDRGFKIKNLKKDWGVWQQSLVVCVCLCVRRWPIVLRSESIWKLCRASAKRNRHDWSCLIHFRLEGGQNNLLRPLQPHLPCCRTGSSWACTSGLLCLCFSGRLYWQWTVFFCPSTCLCSHDI